jgi:photosystem II stability/assembly factor-like uncharacterized protein
MSMRSFGIFTVAAAIALGFMGSEPSAAQQAPLNRGGSARPFHPLGAMHGAAITKIAVDSRNPNFLYAGLDHAAGAMARSEDGGLSWELIPLGEVDDYLRAIAVDPADSSIVVAFGSTDFGSGAPSLYWSSDHGAHWSKFAHQPVGENGPAHIGRGVVMDSRGTTLVLADKKQGIFRSEDFGRSWTNPLPGSQAHTYGIYTDPNDAKTLWTAGLDSAAGAAAWVSHDFGKSWIEAPMPILDPSLAPVPTELAVQPGSGTVLVGWGGQNPLTFDSVGGVIASVNGGKHWFDSSSGIVGYAGLAKWNAGASLAFDPHSPNVVLASGNGDYAMRSVNGGVSWQPLLTVPDSIGILGSLVFAPTRTGGFTLLGASSFFYASRDDGNSWTVSKAGLQAHSASQLVESGGPDRQLYGYSSDFPLERSDDEGRSWRTIAPPVAEDAVRAMALDGVDTLYVATNVAREAPLEIWHSKDHGRTWAGPSMALPPNYPAGVIQFETDPAHIGGLYLVYEDESLLYRGLRSSDGGAHWVPFTLADDGDFPALLTLPLAIDAVHPGWLYAAMASGLWKSTDAGSSWSFLSQLPLGAYGIAGLAVSGGVVYVVAGSDDGTFSLQKSENGGATWQAGSGAFGTQPHELAAVRGDRLVAYQTAYENFFGFDCEYQAAQSTDTGSSWVAIDLGQIAPDLDSCPIVMPTASHLFVADPFGTSNAFGASWRVLAGATSGATSAPSRPRRSPFLRDRSEHSDRLRMAP